MVFLIGLLAAVSLGAGWVLQQRVASHAALSELLSYRLLWHLMHRRAWWLGIGAMVIGQLLGAYALNLATVSVVEPLLSTSLVFAFIIAAALSHERTRALEVGGAILVCAALGVFLGIGNPRSAPHPHPTLFTIILAVAVVAGVLAVLLSVARRQSLAAESVLLATGAGLLYGMQDLSTRACLLVVDHHGILALTTSPWPYILLGVAVTGLLLSQSAFRAARLDYSLPPTSATEPIAAIALAVTVLGDKLATSPADVALELLCVVAMVVGCVLIGRSATLRPAELDSVGDRG